VLLKVGDEGPGVAPEKMERIFDKYTTTERADRRARDSRGIGLRFCKMVAEAHGGRIWVENTLPRGALFCVELPTDRAET
jgi:K+-sensing histidine kinase KdpD